jgi:hypothetical protein
LTRFFTTELLYLRALEEVPMSLQKNKENVRGEMVGVPPTGRPIEMRAMTVSHR